MQHTCLATGRPPCPSGEGDPFWTGSRFAHQVDMLSAILEMLVPAFVAESFRLCIDIDAVTFSMQSLEEFLASCLAVHIHQKPP